MRISADPFAVAARVAPTSSLPSRPARTGVRRARDKLSLIERSLPAQRGNVSLSKLPAPLRKSSRNRFRPSSRAGPSDLAECQRLLALSLLPCRKADIENRAKRGDTRLPSPRQGMPRYLVEIRHFLRSRAGSFRRDRCSSAASPGYPRGSRPPRGRAARAVTASSPCDGLAVGAGALESHHSVRPVPPGAPGDPLRAGPK